MESEYKAAEAQHRLEEFELELNSLKDMYQQSQQELKDARENRDKFMEQRCQELEIHLREVTLELESTKGDLLLSGES
jgi:chromosome segregation ATPase